MAEEGAGGSGNGSSGETSRLQLLQEMRQQNFDTIRFASYRTACKLRFIQKKVHRKYTHFNFNIFCIFIHIRFLIFQKYLFMRFYFYYISMRINLFINPTHIHAYLRIINCGMLIFSHSVLMHNYTNTSN